tara:strand:- start:2128 stop:2601 length:474 start_codon:yes stop_codon:yes gene_type:complete
MPYIGTQPLTGQFTKLTAISAGAGGLTDIYPLTKGAAAFFPATAEQLIVSVNGVTQAPNDAYTVSGSSIQFAETLTTADTIDYILALGEVGNSVVPTDGSVTADKFSSSVYKDGIRINGSTATDNVTIASGERAMVAGDYTIPTSKTLTVNGVLTIV